MIVLLIFGGLMLVLTLFYLVHSIQQAGKWKLATILIALSLAAMVSGCWGYSRKYQENNHETLKTPITNTRQKQRTNNVMVINEAKLGPLTMTSMNLSKQTQAQKEITVFRQLQKNYSKFGLVTFDKPTKTYNLTPTDGQTVKAFNALANNPRLASHIGWHKLTKLVKKTSQQLSRDDMLGKGYQIRLMNPGNHRALYTVKDGQTTFDIARESKR